MLVKLSLLLVVVAVLFVQIEARPRHRAAAPWRHYASRQKDTWLDADNFCRGAGLGGLMPAKVGHLGELSRHMSRGLCYWVHGSKSWRSSDLIGCPCLRRGADSLVRMHRIGCRHRRRFLCLRGSPIDETELKVRTTRAPRTTVATRMTTKTAVPTKTIKMVKPEPREPDDTETVPNEEEADDVLLPGDETVDHVKFPVIALGPDGHPKGWLPPWGSITTEESRREASTAQPTPPMMEEVEDRQNSSTAAAAAHGTQVDNLKTPMNDQNSEFITLLVLYTIVGVTILVLLSLCLVRCCRRCCGKSKIRYVKQVDADDIPRFMPSSWA